MVNVVNIATQLGYLEMPEGTLIEPEEMNNYREDQVLILTTGSQGAVSYTHLDVYKRQQYNSNKDVIYYLPQMDNSTLINEIQAFHLFKF